MSKQFCLRGHDTFEVGRTVYRSCRTCQRAASRRSAAAHYATHREEKATYNAAYLLKSYIHRNDRLNRQDQEVLDGYS